MPRGRYRPDAGLARLRVLLSVVCVSASLFIPSNGGAQEARQIDWPDLTVTLEFDDPFASLSRPQLIDLSVVARYRGRVDRGGTLSDDEKAKMNEAATRLEGIDIDGLLARRQEIAALRRRQAMATNPELEDRLVRVPGYALPLDFDGRKVTEFLLVPWVGACIHTPPPPPNQIISVTADTPFEMEERFEPVWVEGVLRTGPQSRNLFLVDGSADIDVGYSMTGATIQEYTEEPLEE
jgi:hypothetical protein